MHPAGSPTAQLGEQQLLVALAATLTHGRRRLEDLLVLVQDPCVGVPQQSRVAEATDDARVAHS